MGLAAIALSSAASAQDASVLEESETTTETATEAESNAIVVTGSRIQNPNLEQASPVAVVTAEELSLQQANTAEESLRQHFVRRPSPNFDLGGKGGEEVGG